jgi:excisionase family DNA binding protein
VAPSPAIAPVHPIPEIFSGTLPASQALLTVREVAERLRVCTATVYRLIERRTLPALRVAGTF